MNYFQKEHIKPVIFIKKIKILENCAKIIRNWRKFSYMKLFKKAIAELIGTFVLVVLACGTACALNAWNATSTLDLAAKDAVIALAFGLSLAAMAYSVGNISGCHINPAVSFGVYIFNLLKPKEKRNFSFVDLLVYVLAQIIGAFIACYCLLLIFGDSSGFGANQASSILISQSKYYLTNALGIETLLTGIFVFTILGVTSTPKYEKCAGLIIGLTLTLVHLIGIPLTGTSVNPARSIAPAVFAYLFGGDSTPLNQLWIFIVGPLLGALIAALLYWFISYEEVKEEPVKEVAVATALKEEVKETPKKKKKVVLPVTQEKEVKKTTDLAKLKIERVAFEIKLRKADKDIKVKYKALQEELESYGLKSRISFEGDTYRLHRIAYVFITIRGKTLKVYYRLDPKKYLDSPIPVKDEGDKKKYAEIPAVLKVRSDLSGRRAIDLVKETMDNAKIVKLNSKDDNKNEDDKK